MAVNEYPGPPALTPDADQNQTVRWARGITAWARNVMTGHLTNIGEVTLTANAATTAVTDARVNVNSAITFVPTTANAMADYVGTGVWASTVTNTAFTITHPNNANADKTFKFIIQG